MLCGEQRRAGRVVLVMGMISHISKGGGPAVELLKEHGGTHVDGLGQGNHGGVESVLSHV